MSTKELELLVRAKKSPFNYRRMAIFLTLGLSSLLLLLFFVSLGVGNTGIMSFTYFTDKLEFPPEFYTIPTTMIENASWGGAFLINPPTWGLATLFSSTFGFVSLSVGSSLTKTMLFDDKNWLSSWTVKGKIKYFNLFRGVKMSVGETKFYVSKIGFRYKFRIPLEKGMELEKFGFVKKTQNMVGTFNRDELSSILHIIYTTVK